MMEARYEHFDTDRLNAIPITEVARRLDTVRKAGVNSVTTCPWHEDKHPSLTLYERTNENHCHCFSCGKGGSVIDYVMQHESWSFKDACSWLSSTFGISTLQRCKQSAPPKPKPRPKPVEPTYTYIPMKMVDELVSTESSFSRCLMRLYRPEAVEWLTQEYRLGCYEMNGQDDYTVFPNIDYHGRVCNLKIQHYCTDPASERFCHSDQTAYWLGRIWAKKSLLPADAVFHSDCLFGEHLLQHYPENMVALVESPKNALFGALSFQQLVWVATGSKNMLKREVLKPLKGRDVIVIPDCDAVAEWTSIISRMADLANFTVSDFCLRMAPEGQPKFDIADFLLDQLLGLQKTSER